jgi:hypothetical protein
MIPTAIPFLIKSHHRATIQPVERITANVHGYRDKKILYFKVSFDGPGFKKEWIETFPTEEAAIEFVARLGFTMYKTRTDYWGIYSNRYIIKDIKNKSYRNQDGIDWKECYYENGLCKYE